MFLPAALPGNETARLARLRALAVLDTGPEAIFDFLTKAAADVCGVPIALISLIDAHRQWFKSVVGLTGTTETSRDLAFCAHVVLQEELLEVPDASRDPRFAENPLVSGPTDVQFYAGAPICLSDGFTIGTLCVLDHAPKRLNDEQLRTLRQLAQIAAHALEFRERALKAIDEADRANTTMANLYRSTPAPLYSIDTAGTLLVVSDTWLSETGYAREEVVGRSVFDFLTPASTAFARTTGMPKFLKTGRTHNDEYQVIRKDGSLIDVLVSQVLERDAAGEPNRSMSVFENITLRRLAEKELRDERERLVLIVEGTDAGTWELNVRTGELHLNERWAEQIGHTLETLGPMTQRQWLEYLHVDDRAKATALVVEHYAGRAQYYNLECRVRRRDGSWLWVGDRGRVTARSGDGRALSMHGTRTDISARKRAEEALHASRQLLQVTLDSIGDAVITTDTASIVQWLNPVAERMTGWRKADAVGRSLGEVFVILDEASRLPTRDPVAVCLAKAETIGIAGPVTLVSRHGAEYGIEDSASPIRQEDGQVHGVVLVFRDVSEQRRLNHEMSHRATHDPLTGLLNRGEFESRLARLLDGHTEPGALLYIDLDQFKLVNDACGHCAGDDLLTQVASILRSCVRGQDMLARLGGDEFGVILEHCETQHAQRVAQKICDQMDAFRFLHEGRRFRIGTSIGLVPIDDRWTSMQMLLQAADASCYAAKDEGRNRVHAWFDTDQVVKARHGDMQWVSRLEAALDEDRFELFGQRIESIGDELRGLHFEVLLRMRDADGTLVMPGAFLPAAERFHLATRIDRMVVRKAFEWMCLASDVGVDIEMMSVNLSGQSLGDRAFHRDAIRMILRASFDPRKLCFEITETAAITHLAEARTFIDEVRKLGVRIALDDFGAGASSFGYLKSLPVDFLKIDGHFITNLLEDRLDNAAVRCFCDVAKVVGVKTIAEFVERQDVCDALGVIGVDMAQGYLVHRPEPLGSLLTCVPA